MTPKIETTVTEYPQIYAYTIPGYKPHEGFIKIGYTVRKNVDDRIREQTHTAGLAYDKLWSEPAKKIDTGEWFTDKPLHAYLRKFKGRKQLDGHEWFFYNGTPNEAHADFDDFRHNDHSQIAAENEYTLRDEQRQAVEVTLEYAKNHIYGEFLWNAKPRFGKTLTTYDLARRMEAGKVLIVTNRPAIANSWFDDFEKFIAWQTDFKFVSTTDTLKDRPVLTWEQFENEKHNGCIAFLSLQDLKGSLHFGGEYNKLEWVKGIEWDLLVIDEAHEGVDTLKTDVAFTNIKRKFTLHLSGTPFKAIAGGKFSTEQIYNWTYADEQEAKALWDSQHDEYNPYENLPHLNMFSYQMSKMITDEVNKGADIDGKDYDYAFDLNEFFATNDNGKFTHESDVIKWLDTLTRNEKYPFSTKELRDELKHTFWYLNRVASAKALEKLLKQHPVFENYEIILAAGDGKSFDDDQAVNEKALDRVRKAINDNEKTITLSVGQLTTGVTVPEWTAVLMLSDLKSPALYMQAAFRAQNSWSYTENGVKKRKENAYVFDFAPERTLIIYDEFANNLNSKTASGGGTTDDREENIRVLLNFFPVIAEDNEGKMVELDVRQVLTIPKAIKAAEVVRRGFMSNLLFQNISGIFASPEAREILEQLNPVPVGKVVPETKSSSIDTKNVEVDNNGNAAVNQNIVIATTEAKFGEKVYADVIAVAAKAAEQSTETLTRTIANTFTSSIIDTVKELAKDTKVTAAQAEQIVKNNANDLAREVEVVKKQAEIKEAEAKALYVKEVAAADYNETAIAEAQARYEAKTQEIAETLKTEITQTVEEKARELTQKSTEQVLQKGEEKKKNYVEDDIRSRLRGFARTIPSFLMAYGEPTTTLANFDKHITDSVFKEVTGITLDQFRVLRDTYNFFDAVVFDESVSEFLRKKDELANYFDDNKEDIFDYIPPQKTNQIFTPKKVVKMMIDKLQEENPDIFSDKEKTYADLYVKSGLYLTEIVKRLYAGLESVIPNKDERLKHILENQIYGFAPSEIIYNIAKNYIYGGFANIDNSHLVCRDLTDLAKSGGDLGMKFDVVVGNPPYQEDDKDDGKGSAVPIYNLFIDLSRKLSNSYISLITPSVWFLGGKGLDQFRKSMLSDCHFKFFENFITAKDVFDNVSLRGGVNFFLWSKKYDNTKNGVTVNEYKNKKLLSSETRDYTIPGIDLFISDNVGFALVRKLLSQEIIDVNYNNLDKNLAGFVSERNPFGYPTTFRDFETNKNNNSQYKIYQAKGKSDYVSKDTLSKGKDLIDRIKVITPFANNIGTDLPDDNLNTQIISENEIVTETYLVIGAKMCLSFETASNLEKYLKTKFARFLISIAKANQNGTRQTYRFVPLQDFTPQSDIDWTQSIPDIDRQLYKKYGLDDKEIAFIEDKVKAME
jgi:superfamily II DNA or RNA helicase